MASSIPQFLFADGTLTIESLFSHMRLRWKPAPCAEELLINERAWRPFLPEFRLLQPAETAIPDPAHRFPLPESGDRSLENNAQKKHQAFAAFRAELPTTLISRVERFPSHQWPLLVLLHGSPQSIDLADATPVLAWCLANNSYFRERPSQSAALLALTHSRQKQRDILGWLGFPGTDALVRLMRKISPEAASPTLLNGLRIALQTPDSMPEGFAHLKTLNAGVLALIGTPLFVPLLTPTLLEEVAENAAELEYPRTAARLMDTLALFKSFPLPPLSRPVRSIAHAEELLHETEEAYQLHLRRLAEESRRLKVDARARKRKLRAEQRAEQLTAQRKLAERQKQVQHQRAALERDLKSGKRRLPDPPIPGTDSIIPLTTPQEIEKESREQANCVRVYSLNVLEGGIYFYRILSPERATLSVVKYPDGSWRLHELKIIRNGQPSMETARAVDVWLKSGSISV